MKFKIVHSTGYKGIHIDFLHKIVYLDKSKYEVSQGGILLHLFPKEKEE